MNTQRAKEIIESPDMITVTYDGVPIYIQNVDDAKETARIYPVNETENEQEVPVSSLKEQ